MSVPFIVNAVNALFYHSCYTTSNDEHATNGINHERMMADGLSIIVSLHADAEATLAQLDS